MMLTVSRERAPNLFLRPNLNEVAGRDILLAFSTRSRLVGGAPEKSPLEPSQRPPEEMFHLNPPHVACANLSVVLIEVPQIQFSRARLLEFGCLANVSHTLVFEDGTSVPFVLNAGIAC